MAVGVGVGLGIPFLACLWALILLNKREECLRRPALITFPCLLLGLGIGIWAVLKHSPLPYDEKVRVVVGMGVGGPCVSLLWILTLRHFANSAPLLTVIFIIVSYRPFGQWQYDPRGINMSECQCALGLHRVFHVLS